MSKAKDKKPKDKPGKGGKVRDNGVFIASTTGQYAQTWSDGMRQQR
ncbi:hypothetical protein O7623_00895 [Solwaraspora sp. WMMD791]|nr:hypothetical protein [Solwaraspora sp. WMMD791]WFE27803.1 hypothetical protein O7623_00895 [Solwaraspora sp. WMMD791]